jgi:hypothetical protein
MANIVISGDTSGSVTLSAPAVSGTTVLTLPTTSGTLVVTGGAQTIEFAAGTVSAPSITFTGDTNTGIYSPAADTIAFTEGGVESMRIDSSANVGIGTSSPSTKLDVNGSATVGSTSFNDIAVIVKSTDVTGIVGSQSAFSAWASGGPAVAMNIGATTNHPVCFGTNNIGRVTIDSSGNVGIGTSSPTKRLTVVNAVDTTTVGNNSVMTIQGGAGGTVNSVAEIGFAFQAFSGTNPLCAVGYQLTSNAGAGNGALTFSTRSVTTDTAPSERMRIDSSGNVQIGATNANGSKLYVNGIVASGSGFRWDGASTGARGLVTTTSSLYAISGNGTTYGYGVSTNVGGGLDIMANQAGVTIAFYCGTDNASPTRRLYIGSGGELVLEGSTAQKATGTTWSNPSDARLKNNIRDYAKGTDELMQVRVREWEYNGKGGTVEGTKGLGVVADEIKEILPDTVDNYKAKLNADDAEDTDIKKFDATEITWLLVKTVQEQQALITQLQLDVAALESK